MLRSSLLLHRFYTSSAKLMSIPHVPVMSKEVINIFSPQAGQKYLDMTFGAGGHSKLLLDAAENVTVYALDRDSVAYELAIQMASKTSHSDLIPMLGKFSDLPKQLNTMGISSEFFDGILIDCGCSSMQFDTAERGFSISKEGPLDMRMDNSGFNSEISAADVLAHIDEDNLTRVLKVYGEEKQAKKIARAVVEARYLFQRIRTTSELAQLVESACGFSSRTDKLQRPSHVATKTFQALRILVNDELNELDTAMKLASTFMKKEGKIITLSFHSLEDRIIKNHLMGANYPEADDQKYKNYGLELGEEDMEVLQNRRKWQCINKHIIAPSQAELHENPRSRSAKLRAAIKIY